MLFFGICRFGYGIFSEQRYDTLKNCRYDYPNQFENSKKNPRKQLKYRFHKEINQIISIVCHNNLSFKS